MKNRIDIEHGRYWDRPWSLVDGCTPCSPGCDHCWSAAMTGRFGGSRLVDEEGCPHVVENGRFTGEIRTRPDRLSIPLKTRKPTVFAVWNDLFHKAVPFNFQKNAYKSMLESRRHTFLVLSKRPERMLAFHKDLEYFNIEITPTPLLITENIWHGLTVCNQEEADSKIPIFLKVPGKKFLSIEPMLGEIDLERYLWTCKICGYRCDQETHELVKANQIDAVILGGETGPGARPMHPDWVRSVVEQCKSAGVPLFIKQIHIVDMHAEATSEKKALGWFLDGEVTAVLGTHTHVQTADDEVLPGGTAYITDVGMTGPALRFGHRHQDRFHPGAIPVPGSQPFRCGQEGYPAAGGGHRCGREVREKQGDTENKR